MALPTDPAALLSLLSALQSQVATLSAAVATSPAKPAPAAPAGGKKRAKKEAAPAAAPDAASAPAEKREVPTALRGNNERIHAALRDMLENGWPAFSNAVGKPYPGSKRSDAGAWVREDNGKLPDYPLAMIYASYLRNRDDPAALEKARAYREKVDKQQAEKRSAGSASVSSGGGGGGAAAPAAAAPSKRGAAQKERWAKMSEEERAAASAALKARLAAGKAKKAGGEGAAAAEAAPKPKPAESEDEDDGFSDAEEEGAASASPADQTFVRWTFDGERYYKNALNHVLSNDTEWVGIWDGTAIQDAEPPAYLDGPGVQIVEDEDGEE
jgi:hypothetical protein